MDKDTRNAIERATQRARKLLEEDFAAQLEGTFDVLRAGIVPPKAGSHLSPRQVFQREKIVAAIEHKRAAGMGAAEAVADYLRDAAFTTLNRFVALKMLEARELVQECITKGEQSAGYREFFGMAPGVALLPESTGYRLYIESLFDELSTEVKVLFNRRDAASVLWPKRACFETLLAVVNASELANVWGEDETIGWIYQYYNDPAERKKMRDESAVPRNSRELAVRNQFFTPRYVVEFLTDNTLGRTWYEMTQGKTRLKEQCRYLVRRPNEIFLQPGEAAPEQPLQDNLSQEQLLQQPVHIPHRPLKDPREIRTLDPACGSMHFGLYAFDLFEVIYDEAWGIAHDSDEARKLSASFAPFVSFVAQYLDKAAFLREVPRLVIEHNIHGIDIDPRAAQIAGLSLWLRAQRTWQQQGVRPQDRARIRRSNIVCAEPMPGEEPFLDEFIEAHLSALPERKLLGQLARRVFVAMKLAGEAGFLLKIEEEIADAVAEAKQEWLAAPKLEQLRLFADNTALPAQKKLGLDVTGITDETFWEKTEERIYAALQTYAEQAEHGGGFQRRLFADDAARGFAFIDLCRKRYDVVLMNPPFGECSPAIKTYLSRAYKDNAVELYCAFADRDLTLMADDGYIGCITSSSFVLYTDFSGYRGLLIEKQCLEQLVSLGDSVLDGAYVYTASYVIKKASPPPLISFYDLRIEKNKAEVLAGLVEQPDGRLLRLYPPRRFLVLPSSPLCHWASDSLFALAKDAPSLNSVLDDAGVGAAPQADFFSLWWEVPAMNGGWNSRWVRIANGGAFSPFQRNDYLMVDWQDSGRRAIADLNHRYPYLNGNVGIRIQRTALYGRQGITYGKRTDRFNAQVLPRGQMFTFEGIGVFPKNYGEKYLLGVLAFLNTRFVAYFLNLTAGLHKNDVYIRRLPFPLDEPQVVELGLLAAQIMPLVANALSVEEQNEQFTGRLFFDPEAQSLLQLARRFKHRDRLAEAEFFALVSAIDSRTSELCRIDDRLLAEIERDQGADIHLYHSPSSDQGDEIKLTESERIRPGFCRADFEKSSDLCRFCVTNRCPPSKAVKQLAAEGFVEEETVQWLAAGLTSFAIGAAFGRWDVRFATGEKRAPEMSDPFAPLPVCPLGQLQNEQGLPITKKEVRRLKEEDRWSYPIEIPWDGIVVDDPGHPLDLEARTHRVLQVIWRDRWESIEREACEILGERTLRDYFRKPTGFFADHLKRYCKSRRQAPLYWPLATVSGSYTIWLYYHNLSQDTLYQAAALAKEKLVHEERRLGELIGEHGANPTATQGKELGSQKVFVAELRGFHEEIARVAPLWRPDLNDGVILNSGPLWRMIAHRSWQKSVKEDWDALCAGKYDWANLAMLLWPERVVPKCATDRSLAVAHGLENEFWVVGPDGKWKSRTTPLRPIEELVGERSSPAVKVALKSLLDAPVVASKGRGRGRRSATTAATRGNA